MTDRELLELAALAAGYPLGVSGDGFFLAGAEPLRSWNPLTDDGDALRLAVKRGMDVDADAGTEGGFVSVSAPVSPWRPPVVAEEPHGRDVGAATRRAIVRAAAAYAANFRRSVGSGQAVAARTPPH